MKLPCLFLACAIVIAGCGGGEKPNATTPAQKPDKSAAASVAKTDVVLGKGERIAEPGDRVWVTYAGTLKNGTVFDSNDKEDSDPFSFAIGSGDVIKGWDQGIEGMKVGGERKLVIPPALGYGSNNLEKIPANSELLFDIKLLGLVKVGEENVIDTETIKPGTGTRTAKVGDKVAINFKAQLVNGKVVQDTGGTPVVFTIGKCEVVSGIDKGVQGMKAGGVRKIIAPPMVAYAATNSAGVPANSLIHFTVTLVGFK